MNNIPTLVQIMAWRRPGDKPLSEPMMVILLTHICVTRPQWVKTIVATGYLPYQITQNTFFGFVIYMSGDNDTDRILWLISDAVVCVTWVMYRPHHRGDHGTNFLPLLFTTASRIQKCTYRKKIFTGQIPQSNLSKVNNVCDYLSMP